jgi:hypothetical protein
VGGRTAAFFPKRTRRNASVYASTHAATAREARAAGGGIQNLRATPAPRQPDEPDEEELERLRSELDTARQELDSTRQERDDYAATVDEFIKDHKRWQERALTPEKRERILAALGVGKPSPQYKRVKAALDTML